MAMTSRHDVPSYKSRDAGGKSGGAGIAIRCAIAVAWFLVLWYIAGVQLVMTVPKYKDLLKDHRVAMSAAMRCVVGISNGYADQWGWAVTLVGGRGADGGSVEALDVEDLGGVAGAGDGGGGRVCGFDHDDIACVARGDWVGDAAVIPEQSWGQCCGRGQSSRAGY